MRVLVTTHAGVRIGLAYEAPLCPWLSEDGELVQRALLAKQRRPLDALLAWLRGLL